MTHPFTDYVRHGWALIPLHPGTAKPARTAWNTCGQTVTTVAGLTADMTSMALAHAYSGTCALDIDDLAAFRSWCTPEGIAAADLAGPDAVYIASGRENRAKLLYRLSLPLPSVVLCRGSDGVVAAELHSGTRDGRTMADTLPPSRHRRTGEPYRWQYTDELTGHWQTLPPLPAVLYERWQAILDARVADTPTPPTETVPIAELTELLDGRHPDMDYPDWIRVGMAIHHARGGDEAGLALWDRWSSLGDKYRGESDVRAMWRSFRHVIDPVTVGTLRRDAVLTLKQFVPPAESPTGSSTGLSTESSTESPTGSSTGSADTPYPLIPIATVAERPPTPWLVDRLLPQSDLALLYGGAGSGKSFLALDLAFSVAQGVTFFNRCCVQGPVVWVAAEAAGAMPSRARAYSQATQQPLADLPLWVVEQTPALQQRDDALALARSLARVRPRLIVIDTLAAATAGADENSSQDMTTVLTTCRGLHVATGALVLLVHHAGKDASRGARGWSGLRAAVQTEWLVDGSEVGRRTLHVTKQRDAPDGLQLAFRLQPVALDLEPDGASSCVIAPLDESYVAPEQRTAVAHTGRRLVLAAVHNLVTIAGDATVGIPIQDVYDEAAKMMPPPAEGRRDGRYAATRQALLALGQSGHLHYRDDCVYLGSE